MHCDYYHEGECWSTKDRDRVWCAGYTEFCSNGLRKSKAETPETGLMYTAEMVIEAARTHKTYESGDVLFNTTKGFFNANNGEPWPITAFNSLQEIFDLQWVECEGQVMTKAEAETKFNIKIIG